MSEDLIKRLECGIATKAQVMGGFTFDIPATGEMIREAAAALTEAQAEIARLRDSNIALSISLAGEGQQPRGPFVHYVFGMPMADVAKLIKDSAALSPREGE